MDNVLYQNEKLGLGAHELYFLGAVSMEEDPDPRFLKFYHHCLHSCHDKLRSCVKASSERDR